MLMFSEWYKQLFGESEGKDKKGIFPASLNFSTDLHSLGQFVQEGSANHFETVISVENPNSDRNIGGIENYLTAINNELSDEDTAEAVPILTQFKTI